MSFTKKQRIYIGSSTHRWNIKEGATRSGKTFVDYFMILKRIVELRNKDGLVVILGHTRGTLQRNIIEPLQGMYGDNAISNIRADNTAYLFGQKCYCLGADKINQVDRLRGSSIKYCYGDEVVTWNEEVFQMLKSRLDKPYSCFDGTCNPGSPNHWFYEFLQNKGGVDLYRQKYSLDDNPKLDIQVVENLKKEYAGSIYYDRYILGNWVRAEGVIYDVFDNRHIITEDVQCYRKWVAVDYGTQNATCFLLMGQYKGVTYVINEYYYSGRESGKQKTDSEYATDMQTFIKGNAIENIIVDPSSASFIAELRQRGLPVKKAENSVLDGIRNVSSMFSQDKLLINSRCENLIKELNGYVWDTSSNEERPTKENDHACDALRYGCMYGNKNIGVIIK